MAAWKIILTDGLEENGKAILCESAEVADRAGIAADELLKVVGDYDAMIVRGRTKVTPAVFAAARSLKVVGRAGVGVDNIDLNAARQSGVKVVNSPFATTVAVAELAMGLLLSLVRDLPRGDAGMKNGKWLKKEMEGTELCEKTLGIIGFGRIGQAMARRAMAFDMNVVVVCDPFVDCDVVTQAGCQAVSLPELLESADIISLHVPLNEGTRGLIGKAEFDRMKDGVRLVNTARGGVIEETALLEALETGKVAGAALDVFSSEPPGQTALVSHPRIVASPHIGAQTVEAQQRAAHDIATEVLAALGGESLRWQVA
jgi:D-3-phosphoglycerate dehydrogenase